MASLVSDGFRQSAVMFSGYEKDHTILKVLQAFFSLSKIEFVYFIIVYNKTEPELEEEVSLYDSLARKWVKKRVQVICFQHKYYNAEKTENNI